MRRRPARDDSIAHRHFENLFDARHVQIAGVRSEAITGDPKIEMRRLNFGDLSKPAVRPLVFYPVNDERFSLDGFRLLMLDRRRVAIAELSNREFALRWIDLLAVLF